MSCPSNGLSAQWTELSARVQSHDKGKGYKCLSTTQGSIRGSGGNSSTVSQTSALDQCEWLASRPGCFVSGERTPVPTEYGVGWAPQQVWEVQD
jgi:hypothetical protein